MDFSRTLWGVSVTSLVEMKGENTTGAWEENRPIKMNKKGDLLQNSIKALIKKRLNLEISACTLS